jgi:hypothetical protein
MVDLEYRIGGMDIDPGMLKYVGADPYNANHKFVAKALDNAVLIYVAQGRRHKHIAGIFNVIVNLVGGGSCYLNDKNQLVLDDYSGDYDAIPKDAAQKFAELMLPELQKLGVEISGIAVNPRESKLNHFWRQKGFGSK